MTKSTYPDWRAHIAGLMDAARAAVAPAEAAVVAVIERPKQAQHGDFACNVAMQLAKRLKRNPREIAAALIAALPASPYLAKAEIAGAGFINLFLKPEAHQAAAAQIPAVGPVNGRSDLGGNRKVQIEFVSANPTGPLHVGHGRHGALGDALSALFEAQGYAVTREFYYNDAGVQIANLALSVQARAKGVNPGDAGWPETAYNGDYIAEIARDFLAQKTVTGSDGATVGANGDAGDLEAIRCFAVAYLRREQDLDLQAFGVKFDNYYLESSLYSDGKVAATVDALVKAGKTYEQDGALWLRTTEYGDDKDRVMRKSDGSFTYFVPDIAYHVTKWKRGFRRAITELGADHGGSLSRERAGLQALGIGIPPGYPDYVLHQMVLVMRAGEEVKLSKRAGTGITLRELID